MLARCWSCSCGCVLVTPKQINLMSKELKADGANWQLRGFSSHWCWLATVRLAETSRLELNLTCQFVAGYWPPSRTNDGEDHKQPFRPAQGSTWKSTSVLHNESSHHNINGLHHHISATQRHKVRWKTLAVTTADAENVIIQRWDQSKPDLRIFQFPF